MTKERLSDMAVRNVRAWAANRPDMSGSQAIVDAIDELLERRAADEPPATRVPTWRERCQTHPEHTNGAIVTSLMIERRMQEEIDDLRSVLNRPASHE